jgi:hypothetical protein
MHPAYLSGTITTDKTGSSVNESAGRAVNRHRLKGRTAELNGSFFRGLAASHRCNWVKIMLASSQSAKLNCSILSVSL